MAPIRAPIRVSAAHRTMMFLMVLRELLIDRKCEQITESIGCRRGFSLERPWPAGVENL